MLDTSVLFPHRKVNQSNCGAPCRHSPPPDAIHPYLGEVNIDTSLIRSMIKSASGASDGTADYNQKSFLPSNQSIELIESSDNPARLAADAGREAYMCKCGHPDFLHDEQWGCTDSTWKGIAGTEQFCNCIKFEKAGAS